MPGKYLLISALTAMVLSACTYTQKIQDGQMAFDRKQYAVAVDMLKKEYERADSRVEQGKLAYLLAESYMMLNRSEEAIDWFLLAYDNQYGIDALRGYAYGLKRAERYEEAIQAFKELGIEVGSPYEYRREINACQAALGWKELKNPEYQIELPGFNSGFADYAPAFYREDQLVITSDRTASTGEEPYNWTGNDFSDLFLVDLRSNEVSGFDPRLNGPDNEGTITFNSDYTEAYFSRCFGAGKYEDAYCKLMVSRFQDRAWSVPEVLDFVEDQVNYGHPSLSDDDRLLYFTSNHPDGWGGFDIYVSERTEEGWGPPLLMGRSINTVGNEKFPHAYGDTLYFASDFHLGMGGLDVFKSYQLANGSWSPAYNLKPPINSGADDFAYVVDRNPAADEKIIQHGYFTSTRERGVGGDDIYRYGKVVPPPEPVEDSIPLRPEDYQIILDVFVLERVYENPGDPNSRVIARRPLSDARLRIQYDDKEDNLAVGDDGLLSLELEEDTRYEFFASREDYLNNQGTFSTRGIGRDPNSPVQRYELEIVLDKIFRDKEIVLEDIYYDFDESFIREDAKPTLDQLAQNLELNPDIRIELASHTDCRGSESYNQQLSQERAASAVQYLISVGIEADRLEVRGYGESRPAVNCACARCTEEQHQANRRTTFKIID
ncbi:MAG: OmpA family protein [Saprospiraceae bacterium]|nr:OmpA family protein [Saprospiraceae bacterium]